MKRNFKYVTMMATALLIGFSSCSNDDDVSGDGPVVKGEKTMARITLTQSAPGTYAPAGTETPTADEKEVKTAKLYIFSHPGKILEAIVPLTVTAGVADSKVFELTTGDHYFYAAVNAPAAAPATFPNATPMATVMESLLNVTAISDLTDPAATGFFMTNVSAPATKNIEEATEAEATAGTKNDIKIQVGRAVAKVNVDFDPLTQTGGKLTTVQYKVKNNPNKMYFMPVFDAGKLKTPFFNDATVNVANYFQNPAYLNADLSAHSYAMENSNAAPKAGNSTAILVKGIWTPEKTFDKDGSNVNATPTTGHNFWRILKTDGTYMDKVYYENPTGGTEMTAAGAGALTVEYTGGVSYYSLRLADNNITGDAVAKHTVKRNSYYYMTITSVSGPGANTEPGVDPDPEVPVDVETFIKATIEILDWTVIDQSGGI